MSDVIEKATEVSASAPLDIIKEENLPTQDEFSITTIGGIQMLSTDTFEMKLEKAEQAFIMVDKIRQLTIKRLSKKSVNNLGGNVYLGERAINQFAAPYGIGERNVRGVLVLDNGTQIDLNHADAFKGGKIKAIRFTGTIISRTLGIEAEYEGGVAIDDKHDSFHSREDVIHYIKHARSNWKAVAVKKLLGLDNLDWEQLAPFGITPDNCTRVEYKNKAKESTAAEVASDNETRQKLYDLIKENAETPEQIPDLIAELSAFQGTNGPVPGKRDVKDLYGKRLSATYGTAKKRWAEKKA